MGPPWATVSLSQNRRYSHRHSSQICTVGSHMTRSQEQQQPLDTHTSLRAGLVWAGCGSCSLHSLAPCSGVSRGTAPLLARAGALSPETTVSSLVMEYFSELLVRFAALCVALLPPVDTHRSPEASHNNSQNVGLLGGRGVPLHRACLPSADRLCLSRAEGRSSPSNPKCTPGKAYLPGVFQPAHPIRCRRPPLESRCVSHTHTLRTTWFVSPSLLAIQIQSLADPGGNALR